MKGPLPDNYLHTLTPAGLIAWVAQVTLARISLMTTEELIRIGWYGNPVVDNLYSMTSAGVWIARTDAYGRATEANSATIYDRVAAVSSVSGHPGIGEIPTTSSAGAKFGLRAAQIPLVEAGGSIAATVLVPGIAGYFAVCRIKKIWAPAGTTDAANTWTVASEAAGGITGPTTFAMNLTAERNHWADAGAAGVSGDGILVYNTTDDKDITLAAADLAAVGTIYYAEIEYWYET